MELIAARTAVIAVHLQKDIVAPEGAFGGFFAAQVKERGVLKTVATVTDAARSSGAAVVYLRIAFKADYSDLIANSPLLGMVSQHRCLVDGSPTAEIVADVAPRGKDLVLTHQRMGGFSSSALDVTLRSRGIDTLLFTGVATNASVEATARQAADLGYRTVIVEDACSAADGGAHQASIGSLGLVGEIVTSADVVAALANGQAKA